MSLYFSKIFVYFSKIFVFPWRRSNTEGRHGHQSQPLLTNSNYSRLIATNYSQSQLVPRTSFQEPVSVCFSLVWRWQWRQGSTAPPSGCPAACSCGLVGWRDGPVLANQECVCNRMFGTKVFFFHHIFYFDVLRFSFIPFYISIYL